MKECYVAIHKQTGEYFGGKRSGTHIGYPKINFLKSAMTNAKANKDDYKFYKFSFVDKEFPVVIKVEK